MRASPSIEVQNPKINVKYHRNPLEARVTKTDFVQTCKKFLFNVWNRSKGYVNQKSDFFFYQDKLNLFFYGSSHENLGQIKLA